MSVTIDWMDARHSIIHANFVDHWNWSELYNALDKAHTLMTRSHQSITLMLDFIGSYKVSATSALFAIAEELHAPQGVRKIVIVSNDPALGDKMLALLKEVYPDAEKIILTDSHQQAFERVRNTVEMAVVE